MDEMNEMVEAFAELCEAADAMETGKWAPDPQAAIELAETILDFLGVYIAVCALRGGRPRPQEPANEVGDMERYS